MYQMIVIEQIKNSSPGFYLRRDCSSENFVENVVELVENIVESRSISMRRENGSINLSSFLVSVKFL